MASSVRTSWVAVWVAGLLGCPALGADLPSFPGAEGYGATTPGGRGGRAIRVTTLADNGPGSLRAAVNATGPRIVVFAVGGRIHLESPLVVGEPDLTVLGQTAPGGITVSGTCLRLRTQDVIVRGMRFRAGDDATGGDPGERDALNFLGGPWPQADGGDGRDAAPRNIVIDHCSFAWSVDECVGTWAPLGGKGAIENITLSWCLFTEPLNASIHHKSSHGAILLVGDEVGPITVHHSLLTMGQFRHPAFKGGSSLEFVNNLVYNWGDQGAVSFLDGSKKAGRAAFIGNTYVAGPMTQADTTMKFHQGKVYLRDNFGPRRTAASQPQADIVDVGRGAVVNDPPLKIMVQRIDSAEDAAAAVLARAGAAWPQRDRVDARAVRHYANRTGMPVNSVEEAGGWPELPPVATARDADADGLPDDWETAKGLDPRDPADSARLAPSGYAWIEEWANSLLAADPPPTVSAGDAQQVSLPAEAKLAGLVWVPKQAKGQPTIRWTAPAGVTFRDAADPQTTATFAAPGTYTLSLRAELNGRSATDTVTIIVNPAGTPINQPPVVYAGPKLSQKTDNPQRLTWPVASYRLQPKVSDDGLPAKPGKLTYRWELVDNALRGGGGRFDDPTRPDATLLIGEPGRYVCKLTVSDGQYTRSSATTVEVAPPADQPQPRVFVRSPAEWSILPVGQSVRVEAASDGDSAWSKVEFFVDGQPIGTAERTPFAVDWAKPTPGPHRLTARAVDAKGMARTSPAVSVWVAPAETPTSQASSQP